MSQSFEFLSNSLLIGTVKLNKIHNDAFGWFDSIKEEESALIAFHLSPVQRCGWMLTYK